MLQLQPTKDEGDNKNSNRTEPLVIVVKSNTKQAWVVLTSLLPQPHN